MSVITTTTLLMSPCSSRMGLRLMENCPAVPLPRKSGISRLSTAAPCKSPLQRFGKQRTPRRRDHFDQRMPQ